MATTQYPMTPALRVLRAQEVTFRTHLYRYQDRGGTHQVAREFHLSEHQVIKTLVLETGRRQPLLVLMHGDQQVSTKYLARVLAVKRVISCEVAVAQKYTGYRVGGISPFGTRMQMPLYVQYSIAELERIYINGGKRGLILEMDPGDIEKAIPLQWVDVAGPGDVTICSQRLVGNWR